MVGPGACGGGNGGFSTRKRSKIRKKAMRLNRILFVLSGVLFVSVPVPAVWDDPKQSTLDEARIKSAGLKSDGPALLEFFKKRTLTEEDRAKVQKLIRQL